MSWPLFPALHFQLFPNCHQLFSQSFFSSSSFQTHWKIHHFLWLISIFWCLFWCGTNSFQIVCLFVCTGKYSISTGMFTKVVCVWLKWQTCNSLYCTNWTVDSTFFWIYFSRLGTICVCLFACLIANLMLLFRSRTPYAMWQAINNSIQLLKLECIWHKLNTISYCSEHFSACLCVWER